MLLSHRASRAGAAHGAVLVLLCLLVCAACAPFAPAASGGAHSSSTTHTRPSPTTLPALWTLTWIQSAADRTPSPQAAFAASAQVGAPAGASGPVVTTGPTVVSWLATGTRFALALVQLDPAGRDLDLVVLTPDPYHDPIAQGGWILLGADGMARPAPGSGQPQRVAGVALPGADYACSGADSEPAPHYVTLWCLSPTRAFALGRFALPAERPASAAPLTVAGRPGWRTEQDGMTSIVVVLADGETLVCAGTGDPLLVTAIASQAVLHPDTTIG